MTQPTLPGLYDEHARAVAGLEDEVAARSTGPLRTALDDMLTRVTALWVTLFGDLEAPADDDGAAQVASALLSALNALPVTPPIDLVDELQRAVTMGAGQAIAELGETRKTVRVRPRPSAPAVEAVGALPARMREHVTAAKALARHGRVDSLDDAMNVVTQARAALVTAERTARWATNRAAADGVTAVAKKVGGQRLWVPERDACLHCLAYAGQLAPASKPFKAGLTFADKPLDEHPVDSPPRHPNCRCRITVWRGEDEANDSGVDMPSALRREAERSVLLGVGPDTESVASRLRAAERLLASGVTAPKTVLAKARRAVKSGVLPTGGK